MLNGLSLDSPMEDYCYKSSDKRASFGYCNFFSLFCYLSKVENSRHIFPLNGCPVLELLIWSECDLTGVQIEIPECWHPLLVMSSRTLHQWAMLWIRQRVMNVILKSRLLAHEGLVQFYWCVSKEPFYPQCSDSFDPGYMNGGVVQTCRTLCF